ncbi:hypothetical protein FEF65_00420 [Mariprofundus erugo]|uniref:CREG-like beta-barrel domain-containing protein n=1 Tax=Mariprofundus erugo TaxID=2528639 RepID=A0A5R9GTU4_9PROT|nr:pyridoxamine 5'-phosphate oxidase family protein [Mariprofundus erugo]TLS68998.1 hypothetical protein FEF65_00420 [Mariprofundus erugo]
MRESDAEQIRLLCGHHRCGFLSTTGEFGPESSMVPFAMDGGGVPLLHLSGIARHSRNLAADARAGLMICTAEQAGSSVLALPRLSLQGVVEPVSDAALAAGRAAYLQRMPDAAPLFDFPDFRLYALQLQRVYWIAGFGSARELSLQGWHRMWSTGS